MAQEANKPVIVIAAPGYPGTPAEAQPTHGQLRGRRWRRRPGGPPGSLGAQYENTEQGGVSRLSEKNAVMALVAAAVLGGAREGARAGAEAAGGDAGRHRADRDVDAGGEEGPGHLARFARTASPSRPPPGYAPEFVRGALAGWGTLPDSVEGHRVAPGALTVAQGRVRRRRRRAPGRNAGRVAGVPALRLGARGGGEVRTAAGRVRDDRGPAPARGEAQDARAVDAEGVRPRARCKRSGWSASCPWTRRRSRRRSAWRKRRNETGPRRRARVADPRLRRCEEGAAADAGAVPRCLPG